MIQIGDRNVTCGINEQMEMFQYENMSEKGEKRDIGGIWIFTYLITHKKITVTTVCRNLKVVVVSPYFFLIYFYAPQL